MQVHAGSRTPVLLKRPILVDIFYSCYVGRDALFTFFCRGQHCQGTVSRTEGLASRLGSGRALQSPCGSAASRPQAWHQERQRKMCAQPLTLLRLLRLWLLSTLRPVLKTSVDIAIPLRIKFLAFLRRKLCGHLLPLQGLAQQNYFRQAVLLGVSQSSETAPSPVALDCIEARPPRPLTPDP